MTTEELTLTIEAAAPVVTEVLDVAFPLRGKSLPRDHGYPLYGALSRVLPWLHEVTDIGIHPVHGQVSEGNLVLGRQAALQLRVPPARVGALAALIGTTLDVDGHLVHLGPFQVFPVRPKPTLRARFVTIKGFMEPEAFLDALKRQAAAAGLDGTWHVGKRLIMTIQGKKVVGFEVLVENLGLEASLALQAHGLGGRRKMGGGIFVPARPTSQIS